MPEVVLLAEAPEVEAASVVHLVVAEAAHPEDVEDLEEAVSVVGAEEVAEEDLVVVVEDSDDRQFVLPSTVLLWRYGKTGALAGTFFFEIFIMHMKVCCFSFYEVVRYTARVEILSSCNNTTSIILQLEVSQLVVIEC